MSRARFVPALNANDDHRAMTPMCPRLSRPSRIITDSKRNICGVTGPKAMKYGCACDESTAALVRNRGARIDARAASGKPTPYCPGWIKRRVDVEVMSCGVAQDRSGPVGRHVYPILGNRCGDN